MSAALPTRTLLPGQHELLRLVALAHLTRRARLEVVAEQLQAAAKALKTIEISDAAIEDWALQHVVQLVPALTEFAALLQSEELAKEVTAEFDQQRRVLCDFARTSGLDFQVEWTLTVLQLMQGISIEVLATQELPNAEELKRLLEDPAQRRAVTPSLLMMLGLVVVLEHARAGLAPSERDEALIRLAFLSSHHQLRLLKALGAGVDPFAYMDRDRHQVAKASLVRMLTNPDASSSLARELEDAQS